MRPLVACLLALTACAAPAAVPPTSTAAPSTTSTSAAGAPDMIVEGCATTQALPWAILCRAFPLVTDRHVDSPAAADLAAAAVAGVRRLDGHDPAESSRRELRCVIPHQAFTTMCEAIAERHFGDGLSLDDLVAAAVAGMFRFGLDPFSAYVPADYADRLDELGSGHVPSLGLVVGARDDSGAPCGPIGGGCALRVLALYDFMPAERQGIVLGDMISSVDGEYVEGLNEAEAVARLRRPPGEESEVALDRAGSEIVKRLRHEDIRFEPIEFVMIDPTVAYLRINEFSQEAAQAVGQVLQDEAMAAAGALVLDLRDNPGGLVLAAQAVASQFLDGGLVLIEETRHGEVELPVIAGGLASPALRVVVLTNRGTASAAEVVAVALRSRDRASVVGQSTFGKDLVQEVFDAPGGGEFRVSVARWRGPDGTDVGVRGLTPDVFVEDDGGDSTLVAALESIGR